jgi:hypothetical protein
MLAPNFKTADELGLNPTQRDALIKVLGMLERGELYELPEGQEHQLVGCPEKAFSMRSWSTCLCGHASRFAEFSGHASRFAEFNSMDRSQGGPTGALFYRTGMNMAQATMALRDYLTTGRA